VSADSVAQTQTQANAKNATTRKGLSDDDQLKICREVFGWCKSVRDKRIEIRYKMKALKAILDAMRNKQTITNPKELKCAVDNNKLRLKTTSRFTKASLNPEEEIGLDPGSHVDIDPDDYSCRDANTIAGEIMEEAEYCWVCNCYKNNGAIDAINENPYRSYIVYGLKDYVEARLSRDCKDDDPTEFVKQAKSSYREGVEENLQYWPDDLHELYPNWDSQAKSDIQTKLKAQADEVLDSYNIVVTGFIPQSLYVVVEANDNE